MVNKAEKNKEQGGRMNSGRQRKEALFPAAPPLSEIPENYVEALNEIKTRIQQERLRVA